MSFSTLFSNVAVLTAADKALVNHGECPQCRPREGRPEKMRPLGSIMGGTAYQCRRCKHVWVGNTEVTDRKDSGSVR